MVTIHVNDPEYFNSLSTEEKKEVASSLYPGIEVKPEEIQFTSNFVVGPVGAFPFLTNQLGKIAMNNAEAIVDATAGRAKIFVKDILGGKRTTINRKSTSPKSSIPKMKTPGSTKSGGDTSVPSSSSDGGDYDGASITRMYSYSNQKTTSLYVKTPIPSDINFGDNLDDTQYNPVLHISNCKFNFQASMQDGELYKRFKEVIAVNFQGLADRSVNYSIDASDVFAADKLIGYFNAVSDALQIYYFYTSIIAYENNIPHNKNGGIAWFRNRMTVEELSRLDTLGRLIRGISVPPRLNEICFYLMQNFKLTPDSSISAVCKFMPFEFDPSSTFYVGNFGNGGIIIQNAIDALMTTTNRKVAVKLASVIGGIWINDELLVPSPSCIYDGTFSTIWSNSPYANNFNGAQKLLPKFDDQKDDISYFTNSDKVDNLSYALFGAYNISEPAPSNWFYPGLLMPIKSKLETQKFNRISFYFDETSGTPQYVGTPPQLEVTSNPLSNLVFNRCEVWTSIGQLPNWNDFCITPPGYNKVESFSVQRSRYSAKYLIEWIMDLGTLSARAALNEAKRFKPASVK